MRSSISFPKTLIIEKNSARLYIRSYNDSDYVDCLSIYSDLDLTRFFDHGQPRTKSEVDAYIGGRGAYFFQKGLPFGLFSVFLKDSFIFIGQVDVVPTGEPGEVEIGWIFRKEFQNLGYASEAVNFVLIPLIKNLAKEKVKVSGKVVDRIVATAHPKNKASQRMMEKVGLSFYKAGLKYGGNPRNWYELNLGNHSGE